MQLKRWERLRKLIDENGSNAIIEVDGGVQDSTAPRLVKAGSRRVSKKWKLCI